MITGLEEQAELPKGSGLSTGGRLGRTTQALETVVGTLGKTASSKRKCSALWPRCWTDGQELLGWWPGGEGDRTGRKASVYWGVGGSVLLLPDGKLPGWVRLVTRMGVVSGPKSRCLLHRLLHCELLGVRFHAQCSRTGPSPFLLPAHFPIFGTRTPVPLAPSPISNRESQIYFHYFSQYFTCNRFLNPEYRSIYWFHQRF